MPIVPYLVYRGSLKTSYNTWSRITFKHWLLHAEYPNVTYFCGMTGESNRKAMSSFSFEFQCFTEHFSIQ